MRTALAILLVLGLAACASEREGGIANYDALAKARADCAARGEELSLAPGGDPQVLGDFVCKRK